LCFCDTIAWFGCSNCCVCCFPLEVSLVDQSHPVQWQLLLFALRNFVWLLTAVETYVKLRMILKVDA
jgi:hypothetical protein